MPLSLHRTRRGEFPALPMASIHIFSLRQRSTTIILIYFKQTVTSHGTLKQAPKCFLSSQCSTQINENAYRVLITIDHMLDLESYHDAEDLDDFIVSDEEEQQEEVNALDDEPVLDRIGNLTSQLRINESYTSKVLRAHVSVLVSALGGPDHTSSSGLYKLGHDALACLKDLKRWIRSVDERNGTYDVALACSDVGLVKNDLTVILCQWDKPADGKRTKTTDKIMLACLELLVLLTWPIDVNRKTLMKDYTARTNARRAQLAYKQHILAYKGGLTLKAVIRLGLSALTIPKDDREPRDINILRLILFFIRNVLCIVPLPASKSQKGHTNSADLPNGMSREDISLQAVLTAFEKNKVLMFLTSIAHSVLSDFNDESFGLLVVECLSLLTNGVRLETLLLPSKKAPTQRPEQTELVPSASSVVGMQLQDLLSEEHKRTTRQRNHVSTRHGRFGTLLTIQNPDNDTYYTVSGQEALVSTQLTLDKLDKTKNWHKTSAFKYDSNAYVQTTPVYLNMATSLKLGQFVDQLLVSGSFNNLLRFVSHHLTNASAGLAGKGILESIDEHELASYFLTVAWFLRYKRERHQHFVENKKVPLLDEDGMDYGSVGTALSEVNFILLISYFRASYEAKDWDSLHVAMICFREMLLISNAIYTKERTQEEIELASEDDINEDRELAEGIIRKLFSQKQFLDVVINIPKTASKHSPEFLSVVVSVVHILLKSFENLANEDVKLFIKTRRKMSKLNKLKGLNHDMDRQHWHLIDRGSDEEDDEEEIGYITRERKLDYRNTEVRFFNTATVSTHIEYLSRFEDLSHEEIKRGISFFHRLFVVRKDYIALYRLDFMTTIHKLRAYLPRSSNIRRHVEEFIVYFMKKFKIALDRFPVALEVLFPRFEDLETKSYLSTGDLEAAYAAKSNGKSAAGPKSNYFSDESPQPRAALPLEFADPSKSLDDKVGILVYHLRKKKNALKFIQFLMTELERIAKIMEEGISQPMLKLNLGNRRMLINDSHLRLLVETVGFDLPFLQNDETVLRNGVAASVLTESKLLLEKWLALHAGDIGDIEPFLDQVRQVVFTKEQLDFGIQALADNKAGMAVDPSLAAAIGLDSIQLHKVIGLAKRKEYDDEIAAQYYADEDFITPAGEVSDAENSGTETQERVQKKKVVRRRRGDYEELSLEEEPTSKRGGRKKVPQFAVDLDDEAAVAKSTEYVHDSDDDSDDERVQTFFEREEKLRQLLNLTGGIVNKEQLQIFRDSWLQIVSTDHDSQVKQAIENASSLFVEDLDDENPPNIFSKTTTPTSEGATGTDTEQLQKRALDGEDDSITRKRRVIVDDDEDDE